jgi:transcription elongation factor Elf1
MTDLIDIHNISSSAVKGTKSVAQEICNRCEQVAKDTARGTSQISDDYQYLIDTCTILIEKSKNKEIQVAKNGQILTREKLAFDYGIFLKPKKPI